MDLTAIIANISELQLQVAAMQANMVWITRLLWAMITLNGAALLTNGLVLRNNHKKGK